MTALASIRRWLSPVFETRVCYLPAQASMAGQLRFDVLICLRVLGATCVKNV